MKETAELGSKSPKRDQNRLFNTKERPLVDDFYVFTKFGPRSEHFRPTSFFYRTHSRIYKLEC